MTLTRSTDETLEGTICTYTGRTIRPLSPDPEDIDIEDIAHSLSNSCRFTGHVREFYSVAQHSVLCSYIVPPEYRMMALLHDASEAYLSDIARPIKMEPEFGDVYRTAETRLEEAIAVKFGLDHPWAPEVKEADNVLLRTEQRDLMPAVFRHAGEGYLSEEIDPWLPHIAKTAFLDRYYALKHDLKLPLGDLGLTVVGVS